MTRNEFKIICRVLRDCGRGVDTGDPDEQQLQLVGRMLCEALIPEGNKVARAAFCKDANIRVTTKVTALRGVTIGDYIGD